MKTNTKNITGSINKIIVCQGIPGSGKTTWALRQIRDTNFRRANRDDIRALFGDSSLLLKPDFEKEITKLQQFAVRTALKAGHDVIVDDTNLNEKYFNKFREFLQAYCDETGEVVGLEKKVFDIDPKVCIERDEARDRTVGKAVIEKMHQAFLKGKKSGFVKNEYIALYPGQNQVTNDSSKQRCIVCDIDGTLADISHRDPYDASKCADDGLVKPVANVIKNYFEMGYRVFLFSGRSDAYVEQTRKFLDKYKVKYHKLVMRRDGDYRSDSVIKEEIFNEHVKDRYYVEFILDDRDQVVRKWRSMGLTVFQVAYGDF